MVRCSDIHIHLVARKTPAESKDISAARKGTVKCRNSQFLGASDVILAPLSLCMSVQSSGKLLSAVKTTTVDIASFPRKLSMHLTHHFALLYVSIKLH